MLKHRKADRALVLVETGADGEAAPRVSIAGQAVVTGRHDARIPAANQRTQGGGGRRRDGGLDRDHRVLDLFGGENGSRGQLVHRQLGRRLGVRQVGPQGSVGVPGSRQIGIRGHPVGQHGSKVAIGTEHASCRIRGDAPHDGHVSGTRPQRMAELGTNRQVAVADVGGPVAVNRPAQTRRGAVLRRGGRDVKESHRALD